MSSQTKQRQEWGSKLGIILAVAGSAIGLGNFLRFPVQAVNNGGGAFMIPYFISLLVLGIPLMWVEWTIGRYGGGFGHGTAPGAFHSLWQKNRFIKYFGVIGIFGPLVIFIYYAFIESWLLGYTILSLTNKYHIALNTNSIGQFLSAYQGVEKNIFFNSNITAYIFFLITFVINFSVIFFGIKKGIEKICKIILPLLFVMSIIIMIRILTLNTPDPSFPSRNISNALGFLWNPSFTYLFKAKVWLAAAGQIFFTLSVGIGVIITYASYLKKNDDIVLSGLSAVSTNEFAEVILGSSIIIPAAYIFFGQEQILQITQSGTFNLSFITMPKIFSQIPFGTFFAFIWFLLLFIAGITSSISLLQPSIAFFEDEFNVSRKKAVTIIITTCFILCHIPIFFISKGVIGELDFWGGTFCLVIFATVEIFLFSWIFGIDKAWEEMHNGAEIKIPKIYKFIIKYITPTFLVTILIGWLIQEGFNVIIMKDIPLENKPYVLGTRILLLAIFTTLGLLVRHAWKKRYAGVKQ